MDENIILKKSFDFALKIISYTEVLEQKRKFVIPRQLLRCGTSIGANVHEAQNAESKTDFIHKFKIAAREAEEAKYWLLLCKYSKNFPDCKYLLHSLSEIIRLITSIISTSKRNLKVKLSTIV